MILRLDLSIEREIPDVVLSIEHTIYEVGLDIKLQSSIGLVR